MPEVVRHRHAPRSLDVEAPKLPRDEDDDSDHERQVTSLFGSVGGGGCTSGEGGGGSGSGPMSGSGSRTPLTIIYSSPSLVFVFLSLILMNAGLAVVVPSLAMQLEAMSASPRYNPLACIDCPLVRVLTPPPA